MMTKDDDPFGGTWSALANRLELFAADAGAPNAIVFDASDAVVCRGHRLDESSHEVIGYVVVAANEQLERTSVRRVHLREPEAVVLVFAGIYRLAVWFESPCDDVRVEAAGHAHLPTIEALTLSLPSPSGPSAGSGRAAMRHSS